MNRWYSSGPSLLMALSEQVLSYAAEFSDSLPGGFRVLFVVMMLWAVGG